MEKETMIEVVKKVQEEFNVAENKELGFDLDYLKSSGYYVDCVKDKIGYVVFFDTDYELTCKDLDIMMDMYFKKIW